MRSGLRGAEELAGQGGVRTDGADADNRSGSHTNMKSGKDSTRDLNREGGRMSQCTMCANGLLPRGAWGRGGRQNEPKRIVTRNDVASAAHHQNARHVDTQSQVRFSRVRTEQASTGNQIFVQPTHFLSLPHPRQPLHDPVLIERGLPVLLRVDRRLKWWFRYFLVQKSSTVLTSRSSSECIRRRSSILRV